MHIYPHISSYRFFPCGLSSPACENFAEFWARWANCSILQICHFLQQYFHTGWTHAPATQPLPWNVERDTVSLESVLYYIASAKEKSTDKTMRGVRRDTCSGRHKWQASWSQRRGLLQVWAQLHFWWSGQEPEGDDDRQTASPRYQHLPICLCIPQDMGRACVTAAFSSSA